MARLCFDFAPNRAKATGYTGAEDPSGWIPTLLDNLR